VLETPAPADGVLVKIVKNGGDSVTSGEVIATIDTEAKAAAGAPAAAAAAPAAARAGCCQRRQPVRPQDPRREGHCCRRRRRFRPWWSCDQGRRRCRPAKAAAAGCGAVATGDRAEQRVPMTRLRARIAERLIQSKNENAILTTFNEVNMAPIMALRKQYGDKFEKAHGVRLGFMGFFVKAAVAALKKFPILNASVDGNDIVYHGYIDIGIAVGSPRGLVVPILRDADQMSIADIEKKIAEYGQKAKDGKISIEELTGGTFSISNGGVFGSMMSTPIINPPQSAILGIHATKDRAVVENGQVVVRPINYLAMSYDHRIIDGREAVLGLVTMKEALEDPARLLLDV
jgi:2-oxoglutarate dehydrogenase E2 component (dihydrolipoamide succinyltransferase)